MTLKLKSKFISISILNLYFIVTQGARSSISIGGNNSHSIVHRHQSHSVPIKRENYGRDIEPQPDGGLLPVPYESNSTFKLQGSKTSPSLSFSVAESGHVRNSKRFASEKISRDDDTYHPYLFDMTSKRPDEEEETSDESETSTEEEEEEEDEKVNNSDKEKSTENNKTKDKEKSTENNKTKDKEKSAENNKTKDKAKDDKSNEEEEESNGKTPKEAETTTPAPGAATKAGLDVQLIGTDFQPGRLVNIFFGLIFMMFMMVAQGYFMWVFGIAYLPGTRALNHWTINTEILEQTLNSLIDAIEFWKSRNDRKRK